MEREDLKNPNPKLNGYGALHVPSMTKLALKEQMEVRALVDGYGGLVQTTTVSADHM